MQMDQVIKRGEQLAELHWMYISELLQAHGVKYESERVAEHHYIEAFKHGYKHCYEDMVAGFVDSTAKPMELSEKGCHV